MRIHRSAIFPRTSLAPYCEPKIFRHCIAGSVYDGSLHTAAQVAKRLYNLAQIKAEAASLSPRLRFLAMLTKHAVLASLAMRTLSALASPVDSFVFQDSASYMVSDHTCANTESTEQLAPTTPEVHLDDGVFTGIRKGATDQFLGIPFAHPPWAPYFSCPI